MTSTAADAAGGYEYRRAYRPADSRMIGGVAEGLAAHFGVNVFWVRLAFVVATWFNGVGILAYGLLWWLLPIDPDTEDPDTPAGIRAATRRGLRTPSGRGPQALSDPVQTIALLALGLGVLLLTQAVGWGLGTSALIPVLVAVVGVALVWRQVDQTRWNRWVTQPTGWAAVARLSLGLALVSAAVIFAVGQRSGMDALLDVSAVLLIAVIGIALLVGPWIYRLTRELGAERTERARTQERADVAAHLHDSVLQTLAILQKNSDNPRMVATLARRQERELREWLYGSRRPPETTLRGALDAAASQVEDDHGVPVEVVGVGDLALNPHGEALVRAAGEAIVNAAKHSGAEAIDVYAEVGGDDVAVFVRDRGAGFDPDGVGTSEAGTKMGIRESIVARMERHGGTAEIRSAPGDGTEVRLSMPRHRLDEGEES
ncbi:ATP-binding protein [Solicola gregarius]|uniref:PspC domain-containing protein n=1 Tax=Solicola gregarius TaxID=2908642 RepID=A0AA46TFF3_9ACTN|nr:ATP-binding protein [Solicola gregarius]UYM03874.1 PspC domain-containing protein [Solicola gregarius]